MKINVVANLEILPTGRPRMTFEFGNMNEQPKLIKDFLFQVLRYSESHSDEDLCLRNEFGPVAKKNITDKIVETACRAFPTVEISAQQEVFFYVGIVPSGEPGARSYQDDGSEGCECRPIEDPSVDAV